MLFSIGSHPHSVKIIRFILDVCLCEYIVPPVEGSKLSDEVGTIRLE